MFGAYATIADVKNSLGISGTSDDTMVRKMLESASREIDRYCNRTFIVSSAAKVFDGALSLDIPDLLSITTLKTDEDGDYDYDNLFAVTDYILYGVGLEDTLNTFPKIRIEIDPNGDYSSFAAGYKKGVQIIGLWGYGNGISLTPYIIDTTIAEALDASETGIDVTSVTNLSAGQVILIESEQVYIYSISATTLTVERGVNGTTAATHDTGKSIYIYQYPSDVRQTCIELASYFYQNRTRQGLRSEHIGDYSYTTIVASVIGGAVVGGVIETMLSDCIRSYRRLRV